MKTIFIKVASVLFAISMLTSCLGDGDNYMEVSGDFAYIREDDQIGKYAMTLRSGPVKADKVSTLTVGRAYYVSYKASYSGGGYAAIAERFDLVENEPVPIAKSYLGEPYSNVPEFQINDTINPKSIAIGAWDPYKDVFDDNWQISYNVSKKEGDEIEAYYYYDRDNQFENGQALKENQAIIDVRFVKTLKSGVSKDPKNETLSAFGSLKQFREMYRPTYKEEVEGKKVANVLIKFRYIKDADKEPTVSYLGTFYTSGSEPVYGMIFVEE
ncbi:hypothetical protein [Dysgonomonas sp. Marseille-P4361]|uniref:hypothetical protein n=1 Tax=Dysgonomonas sp. Marseille-P4361 TaxID=2161820 RepID=UPI001356889A|nr:hypothetical protein [Dysgonomonas sp. Marseille-P4361]